MTAPSGRKLGRNEPCWCGRGKKYKKCHLSQDEQAARVPPPPASAHAEPNAPLASVPNWEPPKPPVLSPEQEAEQKEWDRFDWLDLDGKIAFVLERVDSNRIDAEDMVEAYFSIRDETDPHRDATARTRLTELLEHMRQAAPAIYRKGSGVYLRDLIQFAVTDQRWEALPPLLNEFAEVADTEIEDFAHTMKMLLYHGQTQPLRAAMSAAWQRVSKSREVLEWGVNEFYGILLQLHVYNYLDTAAEPRADDPMLRDGIQALGGKPKETWLTTAVQHLSAPAPSPWKMQDFGQAVDAESWDQNVSALLFEFMADQRRRVGITFSRSDFFKQEIEQVLRRQISEREPKVKKGKSKSRHTPTSPLVPRYAVLDRALAKKFQMLGSEPYETGAVIELLPAYFHFIARLGLIHPIEMDEALAAFQPLSVQLLKLVEAYGADTHLLRAVETAWSDATLDAFRQDPELSTARTQPVVIPPAVPAIAREAKTFQFTVSYERADDVWFTIEMGSHQTLDDLHGAIQHAAHFDNDHMYAFYLSGRAWDKTTEYGHRDATYSSRVKIGELRLRMKQRFLYIFDFGDEHRFDIQLVATSAEPLHSRHPRVIERHGKMPPQYPDGDESAVEESDDEEEENEE